MHERLAERMLWAFALLGSWVVGREECVTGHLGSCVTGKLRGWAFVVLGENVILGIWAAGRGIAFSIHLTRRGEAAAKPACPRDFQRVLEFFNTHC